MVTLWIAKFKTRDTVTVRYWENKHFKCVSFGNAEDFNNWLKAIDFYLEKQREETMNKINRRVKDYFTEKHEKYQKMANRFESIKEVIIS